jgi:hypothetical protein
MHIYTSSLVLSAVLAAFGSVAAQADTTAPAARVYGYEDTETGTFHAARRAVADATTTTPTTGTVEVIFDIKLVIHFPKGTPLSCSIYLGVSETNTTTFVSAGYGETAAASVAIDGTTATCSLRIPYSWLLPAGKGETASFTGTYTVSATPTATTYESRSSNGTFVSTDVIPASGATSKYTVDVTL